MRIYFSLYYSPVRFERGIVYRWVSELHTTLQGPRLLSDNTTIFYTWPPGSSQKGKKECEDLYPDQDVVYITSAHTLRTTVQLQGPTITAKEAGRCSCWRKMKQGCWIHCPASRWLYAVVHKSLWLLIASHWMGKLCKLPCSFPQLNGKLLEDSGVAFIFTLLAQRTEHSCHKQQFILVIEWVNEGVLAHSFYYSSLVC